MSHLDGAEALVNLAGRSVDCVKTPDHRDEILRSRVEATRVLGQAVRQIENPPGVWVQMSTAHIYGDPPVAACDEGSAYGHGLAPDVGRAWEEAFAGSVLPSMKQVVRRPPPAGGSRPPRPRRPIGSRTAGDQLDSRRRHEPHLQPRPDRRRHAGCLCRNVPEPCFKQGLYPELGPAMTALFTS